MKPNRLFNATVVAVVSLIALAGWAQPDKVLQIFRYGQVIQEIPVSNFDYIEVNERLVPPSNVTATYNDGTVTVSWDKMDGVTFTIYRSSDGMDYTILASGLKTNSYTDHSPLTGGSYYRVKTVVRGSESDFSNTAFVSTEKSDFIVGTLCGYRNEYDDQGEVFGPFETACGFRSEGCLVFDPLYPNRLYGIEDNYIDMAAGNKIYQLDLEAGTYTLLMSSSKFQNDRLRTADFTPDGQYMIVAQDHANSNYPASSLWIVKRNQDGTFSDESATSLLVEYRRTNFVAVHPVNGEVYFNSFDDGRLYQVNIDDYFKSLNGEGVWSGSFENGLETPYFFDPMSEFSLTIHPTGNFAYINMINGKCIYRADYDWEAKRFKTPYLVAGQYRYGDWVDGVGVDARMNRPYQGVFVKNPEYANEEDEYDYYFTDSYSYCVRCLSPDWMVSTFAGRSFMSDYYSWWGDEDGDALYQARFRDVSGIAYNENTGTFYVLDHNNRRIRTINRVD